MSKAKLSQFHYKPLTRHALAKMVYELNKELVEMERCGVAVLKANSELKEKAQKMIARARTEGIL